MNANENVMVPRIHNLVKNYVARLARSPGTFQISSPAHALGRIGQITMLCAVAVTGTAANNLSAAENSPGVATSTGQVPVDISYRRLADIIGEGGLLMIPIVGCSLVMLMFLFERTISLRRARVIPGPFVKRFLLQLKEGQLDRDKALKLCEDNDSPIAKVFAGALKKWGRPAVEIEQAVIDTGERVNQHLRRYLRVFNAVATITPLLGLLGTVVGMIQSFSVIAQADAMGRPELLAGGISKALLTTAGGLFVAIPAICIYLYFVSRADRLVMDIDELAQQVVEHISADGSATQPKDSKAKRSTRRPAA